MRKKRTETPEGPARTEGGRASRWAIALEPRIMYDGAAAHAALTASEKALIPAASGPIELRAATPAQSGGKREVAFIDTSVPDWQSLVTNVARTQPGMAIDLIDGGQGGLAQIAAWAEAHSGYDAIHILSQGGQASFTLGTDIISNAALGKPAVVAELAEIGAALNKSGEIALYGSDIAAGSQGQHLLAGIEGETGAVVVASDHTVGAASQGGDWVLDRTTGGPSVAPLALPFYRGSLTLGAKVTDPTASPLEVQAADPGRDGGKLEVAFVDTSVAGWETLVRGIETSRPGIGIELIDGTQSGLAQMAEWAATHGGYDAIHLLSHGAEAELRVGTQLLTDQTLAQAATRQDLAAIGAALKPGGDLLLYGCDTGENSDGVRFLTDLAAETGAHVAGATHPVGAASLDGSWTLDRQTGPIDVSSLDVAGYGNVLGVFSAPTGSFSIQGQASTYYVEQAVNLPNGSIDVLLQAVSNNVHYIMNYSPTGTLNYTVDVNTLSGVTLPSSNRVQILAASNNDLVVAYNNEDSGDGGSMNAYFVVLNAAGTEITGRTQINTATGATQTRDLALAQLTNGNIAFAYQESDDQTLGVRIFGLNGTAVTSEQSITGGAQDGSIGAVVASSSGGFMVAYAGYVYSGSYSDWVGYSVFNNAGTLQLNTRTLSFTGNSNFPYNYAIALPNGDYLYETNYNNSVTAEIYSPAGAAVSSANVGGAFGAGYITAVDTPSDPGYATWSYNSAYLAAIAGTSNFNVAANFLLTRYSDAGVIDGAATQVDTGTAKGIWNSTSSYFSTDTAPSYKIYSGYSQGLIEIRTAYTAADNGATWTIGANLFEMSSAPAISSVAYDPSTGNLTLTGTNFTTSAGEYTLTDLTLTGAGGGTYTLGNGDSVTSAAATSVVIHIATANQAGLDGLLNATGTHAANSGTTYNLSVSANWDTAATAVATNVVNVADSGTPTLTHSGTTAPDAGSAGGSAVTIDQGTITATDSPDLSGAGVWSGGNLLVQIGATNHDSSHDALSIATTGGITTSGSGAGETISYNGHQIGTLLTGDTGIPGQTLEVSLSGNYATDAAVQALVNAIQFNDTAATTAGDRTVNFTLTDGYGNSTIALSDTVHVVSGPSVVSIDRSIVSATPTNAASVSFTVTFSEAVTGVVAADFSVADTGTVSSSGVTAISGSGTTYTVTVSGIAGDGTIGLNLSSAGSIKDGNNIALTATHTSDQTYTIDTTAPVIANLNGNHDLFVVGGGAALLDTTGSASVTEANIASGGQLTVAIANDQSAEDVIGLHTAAGHITTASSAGTTTISDNGTAIGSFTTANGAGGQNLVVTLASGDTTTQVADLIHALTYNDTSATANTATRTVDITLTDAAGNTSLTSAVTVGLDNRPVVTAGHTPSLARTRTGVALDGAITVTDADGNWNGGTFTVQITGNADSAHDSLTLPTTSNAGIWLNGTSLMYGPSTQIGTASAAFVTGGTAWTFTFNGNATGTAVTALADAIQLSVASGGSLSTRTVTFTATDSDAVASTAATDSVTVLAEPSVTGGTTHAINDGATTTPLTGVTISDGTSEGVTVTLSFGSADGDFNGMSGWNRSSISGTTTYTKDFASAALANTALAGLVFAPTAHAGNVGTTATETFSISATGDTTGLSTSVDSSAAAAITYANTAPGIVAGGGAAPTYAVGANAVTIDGGLSVSDPDNGGSGNWSGGTLLVHIQTGDDSAHDQLSIASTGSASGISVSGTAVYYNNVQIGTIHSGDTGAPGTDLQIDLNAAATDTAVQALAQAIQFGDSGHSNSAADRTIKFTLTDGAAGTSNVTDTMHVVIGPQVSTIDRGSGTPSLTNASVVSFAVTFSESVTGVAISDFSLTATGTASGTIASVSGSGTSWVVTVSGVSGNGTLRLDQTAAGSIVDGNSAGLIGTHTGDQSVTIDTVAPVAPSIAATISPDTGSSSSDRITDVATPTLHGTAEANSTITLYDTNGTTVLAVTTADSSGNWSVATSTLSDGVHSITATATDAAGNVSTVSAALSVTIDTVAPVAPSIATTISPDTGSSSTDRITDVATPTLHGTAEANSTITLYDTNGTTVLAITTADASGNWSVATSTLSDGVHSISATATDAAGNVSTFSAALSITIDTVAPVPPSIATTISPDTGSSGTDRITDVNTPTLHGTAEANSTITLYDTNGTTVLAVTTADSSGNWSVATTTLTDGVHSITATATDAAGNISTVSAALSVTIDTVAPVAPSIAATISPDTGSSGTDRITDNTTPTLHGTAEANSIVTLYDTNGTTVLAVTTADAGGNWLVATSTLSDGVHSITAKATDAAGNVSIASGALSVTIDTVAPAAPSIAATISPDTGSSSTDRITDVNTPTLHGTAEANSTVTLYDTNGTTVLAVTTADAGGNWSVATSTLSDGVHSITATATDAAGNISTVSAALSVTIDTVAPVAPSIATTISPDTGSSSTDRITDVATPTLHGTAEANSTITLYDTNGTTVLAITTADASGNWSVATSTLSDGVHTITAKATDEAGNISTVSAALSVTIDTVAPVAPLIAPTISPDTGGSSTDRITDVNTPTLHGTAEASSTVTLYDTNGTTILAVTTADSSGNWSVATSALTDGVHSITAKATDAAGNVSIASTALPVTIDTVAPAAPSIAATITPDTGSSSTDRITDVNTPTLHGTAEANSTVTLYDTNGTTVLAITTADASGTWSVATSSLSDGVHTITAKATDAAGNVSIASTALSVTIDTVAPVAPSIAPTISPDTGSSSTDRITDVNTPTLHGTAEANSTVTLYDTDGTTVLAVTTADASGNWSVATGSLSDGVHSITAKATDAAGNVSIASGALSVTIDTVAPVAPSIAVTISPDTGSSGTDRVTNNTTPTLNGTAEANSTVTLYDTNGTTVLAVTTADASGNWSVATSTLSDGVHTITATATDAAGNISTVSAALSVTIDTVAPVAPSIASTISPDTGSSSTDRITDVSTPTLHGTAEANSTITLYDTNGTTILAVTTADPSGDWSVATSALTDGVHNITATATDAAGNVSIASAALSVAIDTVAPNAPTIAATITPDTGSSSTDRITDNTTPTLHGTAEASSTVTLYDTNGTTVLAVTSADASGNWSVATSTLSDGVHTITAKANDAAGNVSIASTALSVTIDTVAPAAPSIAATISPDTGNSGTDRITSNTTPTLHGTAEANSTVTLYDTNGSTVLAVTTADASGTWSVATSMLSDGVHSISAKATDAAGNVSTASAALSVTIDTVAPAAPSIAATISPDTGSSSTDRLTDNTTPTLHGTAEANSTITLYDTNGTTILAVTTANSHGDWSVATSTLSDGVHSITAKATDAAGNVSAASAALSVTIDTLAPAAPSIAATISPDTGSSNTDRITSNNTPTLHGTAAANSTVTLYDTRGTVLAVTTAASNGTWSVATRTLADGVHAITAKATDAAGNVSAASATLTVTIETIAPGAPSIAATISPDTGTSSTDRITSNPTPTLHGTAEANSTVTLYDTDGTTVLAVTTADSSGNWSVATSTLTNGVHSITAKANDAAGNVSTASAALSVTIDTVAPVAPSIGATISPNTGGSGTSRITDVNTPTLHGTAEANSTVTLYDTNGTTVLAVTTADSSGNWSVATSALTDGVHTISAKATDSAGNVSASSAALSVTIDTHTPAAPSIAGLTRATDSGLPGITNNPAPTITGTGEPGATITLYAGTNIIGTATADAHGTWFITTPELPDGRHAFTATATDAAGRAGPASMPFTLTIDTHAPAAPTLIGLSTATDTGALGDGVTSNRLPVLLGTAEAGSTVTVYDGSTILGTTIADSRGHWSFAPVSPLADGSHIFTATTTDSAANTSALSAATKVIIAPTVTAKISPQTWHGGGQTTFTLPAHIFDLPAGDQPVYSAETVNADGSPAGPLPAWLSLDTATGTLSGTVPLAASGTLHIRLTLADGHGDTASTIFDLSYQGPPAPQVAPATPPVTTTPHAPAAPDGAPVPIVTIIRDAPSPSLPGSVPPPSAAPGTADTQFANAETFHADTTPGQGLVVSATTEASGSADGTISYAIAVAAPHTGATETVQLSATLLDGSPLPSWLKFDQTTRTISGVPPAGAQPVTLLVTARDDQGHSASTIVHIKTGSAKEHHASLLPNGLDRFGLHGTVAQARPGLTAQIRQAHRSGQLAEQASLLRLADQMLRRS